MPVACVNNEVSSIDQYRNMVLKLLRRPSRLLEVSPCELNALRRSFTCICASVLAYLIEQATLRQSQRTPVVQDEDRRREIIFYAIVRNVCLYVAFPAAVRWA